MGERRFWWGNMRERGHLEDLGIDGEIWVFKKWDWEGGMDWIDLAQERE
jgi:hypothetical protein